MAFSTEKELPFPINKEASVADASFETNSQEISPTAGLVQDWSEEEEKRLVRKADCIVMPLLMLAFFSLQLDRGNIGNALTDFFFRDVHIDQNQFNVGQQLLSVGIVLLEIPSNMVLYYVGPTLWIGSQIIAWSFVATFQAFQKGLAAFLITRLLLGLCESGFIPAGLYTITRWYKRDETSKRFSWYFIGNMLAQACSGLVAYGILHMRGVCSLGGWQWLFIIEGLFGFLVGTIFIALFPKSPANPVSILGFRYFTERESEILVRRVLLDDPSKSPLKRTITREELKRTLTNWRLLPHIILTISGLAPSNTMWSYAPTIVKGLGYGRLRSNAMVSIAQWCQLVLNVIWGITASVVHSLPGMTAAMLTSYSDKWGKRGPMVVFGLLLWWGFALGSRLLIYSHDNAKRFGFLTIAIACSSIWHPVNGSWMALNARSAGERSITMAVFIMSANCSGIIGSQLFQADDAPLYKTGWSVIVALTTLALSSAIFANVQYWWLNRRLRSKGVKDVVRFYRP